MKGSTKLLPLTYWRLWLVVLALAATHAEQDDDYTDRIPIVYSPNYNIGFFYLERLHPFDSTKYSKIYNGLLDTGEFEKEDFDEPDAVDDNTLLKVHTRRYLNSLQYPSVVARALELPVVSFLPNFVVQMKAINPMRYATGGTLMASEMAIEHGMAINLGGGYHHASARRGMGFCLFADISLLILHVRRKYPGVRRFMIVDLDAHQGNGYEEDQRNGIFKQHNAEVYIFDVYNHDIFPGDGQAEMVIDQKKGFNSNTGDKEYLNYLETYFPLSLNEFRPDLVIYNAGTDILDGDPLGGLGISPAGIQRRDDFVVRTCLEQRVPIVMLLSGGYDRQEADIVIDSILNLQNIYTDCKEGRLPDRSQQQQYYQTREQRFPEKFDKVKTDATKVASVKKPPAVVRKRRPNMSTELVPKERKPSQHYISHSNIRGKRKKGSSYTSTRTKQRRPQPKHPVKIYKKRKVVPKRKKAPVVRREKVKTKKKKPELIVEFEIIENVQETKGVKR